ncbi:MAG: TrkA family potassium uptake protein [Candidatus Kapabacteria bacterium]|nr:TrkA family potassium uptake protein [Candidatus Kapabacteria bacterium]
MAQKKFAIIGLGYFGMNLATFLSKEGAEVLVIDIDPNRVDMISEEVTHAVCMDSTDERALKSLGLKEMDAVVVAIGEKFESSITTTALLQEIGVKKIYNRVISPIHERLLNLMGVDELLVPEAEAAGHLASRLMLAGILSSFELAEDYGIFEIPAPPAFVGKTLMETNLRQLYNLNLVTLKRQKKRGGLRTLGKQDKLMVLGVPSPDLSIIEGDIMVIFGKEKDLKYLLEQ